MTETPADGGDAGAADLVPSGAEPARPSDERDALARELDEIQLLLGQARSEADRHEQRRRQATERFEQLLTAAPAGLREAHDQLLVATQRQALMAAQIEVLEGKQKVLRRYAAALRAQPGPAGAASSPGLPADAADVGGTQPSMGGQARDVLAAQEDLRRLIARQMHDGPAQSIANIALQAQVVQRLLVRDPAAAARELDELRGMVQHALEATKTFIFEVRPMVLDDLGLLPTLRRAVRERSERAAIPVELDSRGQDQRLEAELESNLFRIIDDAVAGYVERQPASVAVRLDWMEDRLSVLVTSEPPPAPAAEAGAPPASGEPGPDMPAALVEMIAARETEQVERAADRRRQFALPDARWRALAARAATIDIALRLVDDGLRLEASVGMPHASGKG